MDQQRHESEMQYERRLNRELARESAQVALDAKHPGKFRVWIKHRQVTVTRMKR